MVLLILSSMNETSDAESMASLVRFSESGSNCETHMGEGGTARAWIHAAVGEHAKP